MPGPDKPLERPASTSQYNPAQLVPFSVWNLRCPKRWDPSSEKLPVSYEIDDPNHLIRTGRVLYCARGADGKKAVVCEMKLPGSLLTPGPHEIPEGQRWNGTIWKGIGDRQGQKITADLSTVRVEVQVWNNANPEPGKPIAGQGGRTTVGGEWLSFRRDEVEVQAIVKAQWDRTWVVPYEPPKWPPLDPGKGEAFMNIQVKNVREGTRARIEVRRIGDPADESGDMPYVASATSPKNTSAQPGLERLIVRGQKVVLPDGAPPYVLFNNYLEHWKHEGNNFYMFAVAFGDQGDFAAASERDYANRETACLHMRFTVLILAPATRLKKVAEQARTLHQFLRGQTKYYRSYLLTSIKNIDDFLKYASIRYIFVHTGHGGAKCNHPDHPVKSWPIRQKQFADPDRERATSTGSVTLIRRTDADGRVDATIALAQNRNSLRGLARTINGRQDLNLAAKVKATKKGRYYLVVIPKNSLQTVTIYGGAAGNEVLAVTQAVYADLLESGFPPDENRCPPRTKAAAPKKGGKKPVTPDVGCGNRSHVRETIFIDRIQHEGKSVTLSVGSAAPADSSYQHLCFYPWGVERKRIDLHKCPIWMPRFAFLADACRTMLTTNLGELVVNNGCRYYHGWVYVSYPDADLINPLFRRWIKGTKADPAPVEWEAEGRFEATYHKVARLGVIKQYEPRLMDKSGVLTPRAYEALK
jgi:hypothetical protein